MIQLGVNIDHVATVRQARYRAGAGSGALAGAGGLDAGGGASSAAAVGAGGAVGGEPDPVRAAHEAELGGADGITIHLREDRRHIQDRDVELLRRLVRVKLNLEMAATDEMVGIACRVQPHTAMLVPEGRQEVTTEGGLDVARNLPRLKEVVARLKASGLIVSAFIDAEESQIAAAIQSGFDVCEVHTGPYAHAFASCGGDFRRAELATELEKVAAAGRRIRGAGLRFNAGHALNYHNVGPIAALPGIAELHIGHAIVSRAVFTGLRAAVREMKALMVTSAARGA
ncbi:MAG: pyridoxine 5'-phosphate synthase [Phycisphaeraceae bacterium]|nr:pyridoxine 5'-phosphate synthase [Phycisphaeraceae bacterium]